MFLYSNLFYFFIYAFLGWCVEVIYTYFKRGEWINRGFLLGPLCPIYGVGVLLIVHEAHFIISGFGIASASLFGVLLSFILVTVFTTLLEFITGVILEKLFMTKWWDYSDCKYNYRGYICLKFSMIWGVAGTFMLLLIHPAIVKLVSAISLNQIKILLNVFLFLFVIDLILTIRSLIDFRKLLIEFEYISSEYKAAKDKLLQELEGIVQELDAPKGLIKEELNKVTNGVNLSKSKIMGEFDKFAEELGHIRQKLREQITAIRTSGLHPNGAMKEFLNRKIDIESLLKMPLKTNIQEISDRFNKLTGKISRHRLFRSFPEMQSKRLQVQFNIIREKYNEAKKKYGK